MYGGGFQYRDANRVFGALPANLEIARGDDRTGRDAAGPSPVGRLACWARRRSGKPGRR